LLRRVVYEESSLPGFFEFLVVCATPVIMMFCCDVDDAAAWFALETSLMIFLRGVKVCKDWFMSLSVTCLVVPPI